MSDAAASHTRTVDGRELPTPGSFSLDSAHSHVGFSVRHLMIAKVRGRFASVNGTLQVADDVNQSSVEIEIELASVDTREEQRDNHLRSPDFFDVANHPTMTFRSKGLTLSSGDSFKLEGDLTVHGVTQPLTLDASFEGIATDPMGDQRVGFSATGEVDREAFGLTWNQALETGGVLVGKQARLEIEAEFVRSSA